MRRAGTAVLAFVYPFRVWELELWTVWKGKIGSLISNKQFKCLSKVDASRSAWLMRRNLVGNDIQFVLFNKASFFRLFVSFKWALMTCWSTSSRDIMQNNIDLIWSVRQRMWTSCCVRRIGSCVVSAVACNIEKHWVWQLRTLELTAFMIKF